MNQLCKVCGEPAAGFHFGAFTCEGCKSFFGRTYNNISAIAGCKNNGDCVINKKNRTACKACRLRKCLLVGMSKSGSRYGRRSNWFKIHCLLQEQQTQHQQQQLPGNGNQSHQHSISGANLEQQLNHFHQQLQARQTYQDKTNPSIKTASMSPTLQPPPPPSLTSPIHHAHNQHRLPPHNFLIESKKFLNGNSSGGGGGGGCGGGSSSSISQTKSEPRLSSSPSDSGASSAGDVVDDCASNTTSHGKQSQFQTSPPAKHEGVVTKALTSTRHGHNAVAIAINDDDNDDNEEHGKHFPTTLSNSNPEPLTLFSPLSMATTTIRSPFAAFAGTNLPPPPHIGMPFTSLNILTPTTTPTNLNASATFHVQDEPIDLSIKSNNRCGSTSPSAAVTIPASLSAAPSVDITHRPAPLDLTLVRPMSG